jgi:ferredoxin
MLKDSFSHAGDDAFRRALREAQVEAQRLIEATQSALQDSADLLSTLERAHIDAASPGCSVMIGDDASRHRPGDAGPERRDQRIRGAPHEPERAARALRPQRGPDIPMTQIIVLPHVELCPDGAVIDAAPGTSMCDALLGNDIEIEHACEKSCACTTCHVIVREGFDSLGEAEETRGGPAGQGLGPGAEVAPFLPGHRRRHAAGDRDSEIHHQHGQGRTFQEMKWTDSLEIAIAAFRSASRGRSDTDQFCRSDDLGHGACPASRKAKATAAKRSSKRYSRPGSTRSSSAAGHAGRHPLPPGCRGIRRRS